MGVSLKSIQELTPRIQVLSAAHSGRAEANGTHDEPVPQFQKLRTFFDLGFRRYYEESNEEEWEDVPLLVLRRGVKQTEQDTMSQF